jgi:hypothetical protein
MDDALKQHLREEHDLHEATEGVDHTDDVTMYAPGLAAAELVVLHHRHHDEHTDLLSHSHPEGDGK